MENEDNVVPRDSELPPGFDEEDPYAGEDLSEYPAWWREIILEFRDHEMRPYRPPRFIDDELVPRVISRLSQKFSIDIELKSIDPQAGGDWMIWVDDTPIDSIERERVGAGYTVYDLDSETFEKIIQEAVDE